MKKYKYAGKTLKIKSAYKEIDGKKFIAEDYWINIYPYESWEHSARHGVPAAIIYLSRIVNDWRILKDDYVVYGKINGMGFLVHEVELFLPEEINKKQQEN